MRICTAHKDITIGLCFSYYNAEKEIVRALTPWHTHVDHIIAVDGRYKTPLTPDMRKKNLPNYSTDESEYILNLRFGRNLTHDKLFDTQIEKRQKCFDIAGELGCDVVIVWDSDDLIHPDYQYWNKFFKQIEAMVEYFPEEYTYKMWAWIPKLKDWSPQHNAVSPETWIRYDRVHRDPKNLKYVNSHYTWTTKDVTTEQINQWKWSHPEAPDTDNPYYKQGSTILDGIRITTNRALRTKEQLLFGDGWAWQNMHWENFEYNVKPYVHHQGLKFEYEDLLKEYPTLEYYFDKDGRLIPYYEKDGQYIIIKPDRTKEVLQEALAK